MIRPLAIAGLALLATALALAAFGPRLAQEPPTALSDGAGPAPTGPFVLQRCDGSARPFSEQDLRGRVHLVYFGFTTCPDVCPTELAWMTRVLRALGEDAAAVAPLFITVDPERDDAERLRAYAACFDERILPLRGDAAQTRAAAEAFGAIYRKQTPVSKQPGFYLVDHTLSTFVVDREGRIVQRLNSRDTPPRDAALLIRRLIHR
ncbi:MAG: SCO family protein [Planctomycetota bacterium]|nr:SCO family protein [Planctomycetota bacterium]MCX8039907.1 SCO family protein [Planctomycetota bacterium]MDW8373489.1 SCO family protein [Planctomycetota bacterium]